MNKETVTTENKEEDLEIIPLIYTIAHTVIKNWKWFVISIVTCLGMSFIYTMRQPQVFQRYTVMMAEDEGNNNRGISSRMSRASGAGGLMSLYGVSAGDNIQNEIYILQSFKLMSKVVEALRLDETYTTPNNLRTDYLYKKRPLDVEFLDPRKSTTRFDVEIINNSTCKIYNMKGEEGKIDFSVQCNFNIPIKTPIGNIVIHKTKYVPQFAGKTITVTRHSIEDATLFYLRSISAGEVDKESSLIKITCNDTNIERADDILNTLLHIYKQNIIEGKNRIAANTETFVQDRIKLIGEDLNKVESNLASFKKSNKVVDFEKTAEMFISESSTNRQSILKLETQNSVLLYLKEYLKNASNKMELIPMLGGLGDMSIQTQISGYNDLLLQRNRLIENSGEDNIVIKDIDRNLVSMKNAILGSLENCLSTTAVQLSKSRSVEGELNTTILGVPEKEKEALDISRQQAIKEALYTYLLNKREEVAMQLSINEASVRIVEDPIGSRNPVSPRKSLIMLIGLIIGIALPSFVFWLKTVTQTTVRGRKDIEAATTIPILGEIPYWENEDDDDNEKIITGKSDKDYIIAEAFRMIRYSVGFMSQSAQVIMLTSTTPGQGKSFISRNLSVILGMADKRVILIDADIRKQTQSNILYNGKGLTSYLSGDEEDISKLIAPKLINGRIDFLSAGIMPPNPAELLMSDKLDKLVEHLRKSYDYVIIDTPPAVLVADANIINRVVDLTIYSVRVGIEDKRFLPELEKFHLDKKYKNLCVVVNGSLMQDKGSAYGYGYGYGYGYEKSNKKSKKNSRRFNW